MRALDTNILVHAVIESSSEHERARRVLTELAEGSEPWALPWPCAYEFLRVVTHPRVFHPPMPVESALRDLRAILASPGLVMLAETPHHAEILAEVIGNSGCIGNLVHDAHIAVLCLEHGVSEFLTADRDFARFAGLRSRNPLA